MSEDQDLRGRLAERDRGLARLRRTTRWLTVGATALAGVFAGLAAEKASGHKPVAKATTAQAASTAQATVPAPPSLPSAGSAQVTPSAPAPAQAPVQSSAPPVAASGGS
jgi:hypothetical protein